MLTGQTVDAALGKRLGLIDRVVPHQELRTAIEQAVGQGKTSAARQGPAELGPQGAVEPDAVAGPDRALLRVGPSDGTVEDLEVLAQAKRVDLHRSEAEIRPRGWRGTSLRKIRRKAPLAVQMARRADPSGGEEEPLEEGLRLEMSRMDEIFRTRDALEGLSTLGRRAPEFIGE